MFERKRERDRELLRDYFLRDGVRVLELRKMRINLAMLLYYILYIVCVFRRFKSLTSTLALPLIQLELPSDGASLQLSLSLSLSHSS